MGLDSGQSIYVYCAGYYYRTGTLAVHIYMNRILLAKFQAMSPSTLDSSTSERSHLAAVLYAALFLDSFGLLDADAYKRDNQTVDLCVAHKGIYKLATQDYASFDNYDLWSQLRPLFKDKPFVTVSIADRDTIEFKEARADAKLFHRDHPPPGTKPLPLSPGNPAVLKLNGETIVHQFDEMNHRAYASPAVRQLLIEQQEISGDLVDAIDWWPLGLASAYR